MSVHSLALRQGPVCTTVRASEHGRGQSPAACSGTRRQVLSGTRHSPREQWAHGLPRLPFREVDHLHVLGHTVFKFLLKPHKECTIKSNLPLKPQALLTATSVTTWPRWARAWQPACTAGAAWLPCQLKGSCSGCDRGTRVQRSSVRQEASPAPGLRETAGSSTSLKMNLVT